MLIDCLALNKFEKFVDLLENHPDLDATQRDHKNRNLLHIVVKYMNPNDSKRALEILKLLIDKYKVDLYQVDKKDRNILHYAKGNYELFT